MRKLALVLLVGVCRGLLMRWPAQQRSVLSTIGRSRGLCCSRSLDDDDRPSSVSRSAFLSSCIMVGMMSSLPAVAATIDTTTTSPLDESSAFSAPQSLSSSSMASTSSPRMTFDTESSSSSTASWQRIRDELLSGLVAGASVPVTKAAKYPFDTAAVRLQLPNSPYRLTQPVPLLRGSFRGVTVPLAFNVPAGAVFFAVKDAVKSAIGSSSSALPPWVATAIAVSLGQIPYWLIRNPSEVVKTRIQAGVYGNATQPWQAFGQELQEAWGASQSQGPSDAATTNLNNTNALYVGYGENLAYAIPADVLKFVLYEQFAGGRKQLSPLQGALTGSAATCVAQFLTTPLDVVRNRRMATPLPDANACNSRPGYFETLVTLYREEGLTGLFAGASPRVSKAILSGAIQFATYEETKQSMSKLLRGKKE